MKKTWRSTNWQRERENNINSAYSEGIESCSSDEVGDALERCWSDSTDVRVLEDADQLPEEEWVPSSLVPSLMGRTRKMDVQSDVRDKQNGQIHHEHWVTHTAATSKTNFYINGKSTELKKNVMTMLSHCIMLPFSQELQRQQIFM